jgi:hypothetical protein
MPLSIAASPNRRVNLRHIHLRLDVLHPLVMADVGRKRKCRRGLRGCGEPQHCGGQTGSGNRGKSELLHFRAFFRVPLWEAFGGPFDVFRSALTD